MLYPILKQKMFVLHINIFKTKSNFTLLSLNMVQAALSKFGLPCAFLGKSDSYSFS